MTEKPELKDDLLPGAQKIADHLGESVRKTYYLLENGLIPAKKRGDKWISRKSALDRAHSVDFED